MSTMLEVKHDMLYIINLEHRKDRWIKMEKLMKYMNITKYKRFPAINGRSQDIYSYWYRQLITHKHYKIKSPGAYGYILTYYYLLQDAMKNKYKSILIMDDDVIIHKKYHEIINDIVSQIPDDFKLIYYGTCHQNHRNNINNNNINKLYTVDNFLKYFGNGNIDGSYMIGISSFVYSEIINALPRTTYPVDSGILKEIYLKYRYNCYVIFPNIAIQDMSESDIQDGISNNKQKKLTKEWGWNIDEYLSIK